MEMLFSRSTIWSVATCEKLNSSSLSTTASLSITRENIIRVNLSIDEFKIELLIGLFYAIIAFVQSIFGGPVKKVLIVDDDVLLIETLANILTSHGYQVDSAENGKVAFQKLLNYPNEFDILITDFNMPIMTGGELVREVMKFKIDLEKIIVVSGLYGFESSFSDIRDDLSISFQPKPYSLDQLLGLLK
jgi:CheY-like chemotaxis protein